MRPETKHAAPLRVIAFFEVVKGVLALVAAAGLLGFLHRHTQHAVDDLLLYLHLDPASDRPRFYERLLHHVNDSQLQLVALGLLAYTVVRFVEGWGLWYERRWAEWLAALSGGIYLPIEVYELFHTGHWLAAVFLAVNLGVVTFLGVRLWQDRGRRQKVRTDAVAG